MNFIKRNQSLNFVIFFFLFSLFVTIASELAMGLLSTSFVKVLGKTLMLCLAAIALDLVWGYCGILSLGHMAFFALGGYLIGMWLMYERTKEIGIRRALGATPKKVRNQILIESIFLTLIAGIIGIILATIILFSINYGTKDLTDFPYTNPTVPLKFIFGALFLMITLGCLIGMIPAQKAVKIRPIEALREE